MTDSDTCMVEGCDASGKTSRMTHGWCSKHYQRWKKHGDPLGDAAYPYETRLIGASIEDRFWAKVDKDGPVPINRPDLGPCWIWTAAITTAGYGAFNLPQVGDQRKQDFAHIWAWKKYVGPVPPGHQLDHLCHTVDLDYCDLADNCPHRACVNYEQHLEAVTAAVNTMRSRSWAASKKRQVTCKRRHLLVAPNLSTTPSDLARNTRRCQACAQTHVLLSTHRRAGHPDSEFNFQTTSDLIYNKITGLIPEQSKTERETSNNHEQLHRVNI